MVWLQEGGSPNQNRELNHSILHPQRCSLHGHQDYSHVPSFCRSDGQGNSKWARCRAVFRVLGWDIKNRGPNSWAKKELKFESSFQDPK